MRLGSNHVNPSGQNLNALIKDLQISGLESPDGSADPTATSAGPFEPGKALAGTLDELKMFNRVLTAEQIKADMEVGAIGIRDGKAGGTLIAGAASNLLGYWPFNEGFGDIAGEVNGPTCLTGGG